MRKPKWQKRWQIRAGSRRLFWREKSTGLYFSRKGRGWRVEAPAFSYPGSLPGFYELSRRTFHTRREAYLRSVDLIMLEGREDGPAFVFKRASLIRHHTKIELRHEIDREFARLADPDYEFALAV